MGLPISPQCNPETTSMPASQIGFIKFIVLPSYQLLGSLLPEVESICVKQLDVNLIFWQDEANKFKTLEDKKEAIGKRNSMIFKSATSSQRSLASNVEDSKKEDLVPILRKDELVPLSHVGRKSVSTRALTLAAKSKGLGATFDFSLSMRMAMKTMDGSMMLSGSDSAAENSKTPGSSKSCSRVPSTGDTGNLSLSLSRSSSKRAHIARKDGGSQIGQNVAGDRFSHGHLSRQPDQEPLPSNTQDKDNHDGQNRDSGNDHANKGDLVGPNSGVEVGLCDGQGAIQSAMLGCTTDPAFSNSVKSRAETTVAESPQIPAYAPPVIVLAAELNEGSCILEGSAAE